MAWRASRAGCITSQPGLPTLQLPCPGDALALCLTQAVGDHGEIQQLLKPPVAVTITPSRGFPGP
ncbi:MAG: hypothetical protein ERJ68_09280 [Aphanocapsa feldmannii 277cI]|uniref:Uncharacterized protein n=1 Tax=Aphanocapsa feldmannii 277cI TaxID=2507554 RepID=A0A524RRG2_9CHRO|nr:MAG: hypothetical protein ERJ68_09280 [Aphanocapsa feldmannii 277cI]